MRKLAVLLLLVVPIVFLSGAVASTSTAQAGDARVRVAHASPDAPDVDVWVDGVVVLEGVPFRAVSDYLTLPAGDHNVKVSPAGATEPIVIDADLNLEAGTDYTVAAIGLLADIRPLVLIDDNGAPEAGTAHVRFVHASPDAPAVDVAVKGGPVIISDVAFGEAGVYTPVDMDRYDLEVRAAGTETVALELPGVVLRDGNVYTVFAMGLLAGGPDLEAVLTADVNPARVRVAHASPDAPTVDILVNDGKAFGEVSFIDVTDYAALPAGTYNIKVVPAGLTEPVVIEADIEVVAGMDYTVAATGRLGDIAPLVLEDNSAAPEYGKAHLRFVHVSPDAPAVTIAVKEGPAGERELFSGVEFREVGDYARLDAGEYDFDVTFEDLGFPVTLDLGDWDLEDGHIYTLFAMGLLMGPGELKPVETVDARYSVPAPPGESRLRVGHASPDAPNVDVWVDGAVVLEDVPFRAVSDYLTLPAADHNVKVSPAGAAEPIVIDADLTLEADTDYTVAAIGMLADIRPLVLVDDNGAPEAGNAHVRFVHASPDAPAVDIAVTGGPVVFPDVGFGATSEYVPVEAGTYDLEVRPAGTETVALPIPGVELANGTVYTVFAMGLLADASIAPVFAVDSLHDVGEPPRPRVYEIFLPFGTR